MLINGFKNFNIGFNKVQNYAKPSAPKFNTGVQKDTFQKSSPSFCGKEYDSLDYWIDNDLEEMLQDIEKEFGKNTADLFRQEAHTKLFVEMLLVDNAEELLTHRNADKISLRKIFLPNEGKTSIDMRSAIKVFEHAGIHTFKDANKFIQKYRKIPNKDEVFAYREIEIIDIYGALSNENKDGITKFPKLLLHLYDNTTYADGPKKIDNVVGFLKENGVEKEDDFDKKFGHLKKYYNNFEDTSDRADCIEYLIATYDDKIELIENLFKKNNIKVTNKENPKKLYAKNLDIIDYLYNKNDGQSLGKLEDILEIAISRNKIKDADIRKFEEFWGEINTPESILQLFEFLSENETTAQEFSSFLSKDIISDINPVEAIKNKKGYSNEIIDLAGVKQGNKLYKEHKSTICAICEPDANNKDNLELFIKLLDGRNIKNSKDLLAFYNEVCNTKQKSLTKKEFSEFFELFKYQQESLFKKQANGKPKKITLDELKNEKALFESLAPEIKKAKEQDKKEYLFGKTPLEIYKNQHDCILNAKKNNQDIASAILYHFNYEIDKSTDPIKKAKYIGSLGEYIKPMSNLSNFIETKGIKFNNTKEDDKYIENCLAIFEIFNSEDEKSKERMQYFIESDFLTKSRGRLNELLEKTKKIDNTKAVLSVIADKKIPSIASMEDYFRIYKGENDGHKKLFNYLKNNKTSKNFDEIMSALNNLQARIYSVNLPVKINGDNIEKINLDDYQNSELEDIITLLNSLYEANENENFLSPMCTVKYKEKEDYSAYNIANELSNRLGGKKESYQNIARLLLNINTNNYNKNNKNIYGTDSRVIVNKISQEFVDFVNSNDWLKINNHEMVKLPLHARLRAIDRFALKDAGSFEELYQDSTKEKLKNLINTIYTQEPTSVFGDKEKGRIIVDFEHNSNIIEAVFSPETGDMITVVPKRHQR